MGGDSDEKRTSSALDFCLQEHDWLLEVCKSTSRRLGLPNHLQVSEDIADDVYVISSRIRQELWDAVQDRRAYLARMIENHVKGILRREREIPTDADELEVLNNLVGPYSPQSSIPDVILIKELLSRLTDEEKELFELRFYERLPTKQIATILRCGDALVRQKVVRLRLKLQEILNSGGRSAPGPRASRGDAVHTSDQP
jgi:RNA polymerase sigma factor (sigma-70 family)